MKANISGHLHNKSSIVHLSRKRRAVFNVTLYEAVICAIHDNIATTALDSSYAEGATSAQNLFAYHIHTPKPPATTGKPLVSILKPTLPQAVFAKST
jgi:hypothetical protein